MAGAPKGNVNATKDKRLITSALNKAATQNPDKLRTACMAVLNKAADGDLAAFSLIADRLDGKPAQSMTLSGDENAPIAIMEVTLVRPSSTEE